jgi:hypothetical protein
MDWIRNNLTCGHHELCYGNCFAKNFGPLIIIIIILHVMRLQCCLEQFI